MRLSPDWPIPALMNARSRWCTAVRRRALQPGAGAGAAGTAPTSSASLAGLRAAGPGWPVGRTRQGAGQEDPGHRAAGHRVPRGAAGTSRPSRRASQGTFARLCAYLYPHHLSNAAVVPTGGHVFLSTCSWKASAPEELAHAVLRCTQRTRPTAPTRWTICAST